MSKPPVPFTRGQSGRTGEVASQTARAFVELREMLLLGEFERGERISEPPLVARLGMSRTPIRLALERLGHIGFVDVVPTGGFAAGKFTIAEVLDAIEVRAVLEGAAARLAAERLTDGAELDPLRHYGARMRALKSLTIDSLYEYMDLNEEFHAALVDLAKSVMLRHSIAQVSSLPFASPSAMVFPASVLPNSDEMLATANLDHDSIIEAVSLRQGTRAESLAREHAFIARRVLEAALSNTNALSRIPGGALINVQTGR